MGNILFIRVSAETYDAKDVPKSWPALYTLIWGTEDDSPLSKKILPPLAPEVKRGVLQLLDAFVDHARHAKMDEERRKDLLEHAERLYSLRQELDEALGGRDVRKATGLTNAIEDALDKAEKTVRNL